MKEIEAIRSEFSKLKQGGGIGIVDQGKGNEVTHGSKPVDKPCITKCDIIKDRLLKF
jgi:hypothetical protein